MAKKFVRGITDVKTINNQDFDTNNVNDLLSDGQYNYIHRKKGKNEEYHNLTDNIKTISSDNTELLSVTNNNKTTNTATLHPKHDAQKEQVLESTRNTITINHGTNGTAEKTTVDTNPEKVLEHENLITDYGISKRKSGNTTKLGLEYTRVQDGYDLNNLLNGCVRAGKFLNAPQENSWFFVSAFNEGQYTVQHAISLTETTNKSFTRLRANNIWGNWREQVGDKSVIDDLLAQKQDTLVAGDGITIQDNTISASGGGAHDAQKEQFLESTRNTVTINHGTNGTDEKTTVDTNPQKVLEHENLVSDSEYITLNHQTGENVTHIQAVKLKEKLDNLQQTKQDTLTAGDGITIQGNTISASGLTSSIEFSFSGGDFQLFKYVVKGRYDTFVTYTFDCDPTFTERVLAGELKQDLEKYVGANETVSNSAITLTNDGTNIKLIKSGASQNVIQQATFTFHRNTGGGGGGAV